MVTRWDDYEYRRLERRLRSPRHQLLRRLTRTAVLVVVALGTWLTLR